LDWYDKTGATASGCYFNTEATAVSKPPVADFGKLKLVGQAGVGGKDAATIQTADGTLHRNSFDANALNLAKFWTGAEFNVFGDCCAYEAFFNTGTNMVVRIHTTSQKPPDCFLSTTTPDHIFIGATAETNNLDLVSNSCAAKSPSDITFTQSGGGDPVTLGFSIGNPL
jgi:hypothetical protein